MNSCFYIHKLDLMKLVSIAAVIMFTSLPAGAMITDDDSDDEPTAQTAPVIATTQMPSSENWSQEFLEELLESASRSMKESTNRLLEEIEASRIRSSEDFDKKLSEISARYKQPISFDFTLPPVDVNSFVIPVGVLIPIDSSNSKTQGGV